MCEPQQLCLNFDIDFVSLEGFSSPGSFASGWAVAAPWVGMETSSPGTNTRWCVSIETKNNKPTSAGWLFCYHTVWAILNKASSKVFPGIALLFVLSSK